MCNMCKNLPCKPTCPYDNIFCSRECAEAYYDIREYDWTESDIKYTYQKIPVLWGDLTYDKYQVKYEIVEECDDGNYLTRRT